MGRARAGPPALGRRAGAPARRTSSHPGPAVDVDRLAGDVRGLVGGQVGYDAGDLARLALAAQGDEHSHALLDHLEGDAHALAGAAEGAVHHVRVGGAGAERVHGDLVRRQLAGEHLREADDSEFGGRVAAVLRLRDAPGERRHVDNATALALLDEDWRHGLAGVVDAVQVDVDLAEPFIVIDLPEVLLAGYERQAVVVHQDVDAAELGPCALDHLPDLLRPRYIRIESQRLSSGGTDLFRDGPDAP